MFNKLTLILIKIITFSLKFVRYENHFVNELKILIFPEVNIWSVDNLIL